MAYYYKFGRSYSNNGAIGFYVGTSPLEEIPDLCVECGSFEAGGEDEKELLQTLDFQIEVNSVFKTPVALGENFAIEYAEAVQLREMIKQVPEIVENAQNKQAGEDPRCEK